MADRVGRLLGIDAFLCQAGERAVDVVGRDRDVPVAGADVVGVHAEVVGELQPRHVTVAGLVHEHVDRLIANRNAPDLLEAERLIEGDRTIAVGDAVAGVDQWHGGNLLVHPPPPPNPPAPTRPAPNPTSLGSYFYRRADAPGHGVLVD